MLLLATQAVAQMHQHAHPNLGRLLTPRHYDALGMMLEADMMWAADNDGWGGVDFEAYSIMLDALQDARIRNAGDRRAEAWKDRCLFVTVPDIVADCDGTAHLWGVWASAVRRRGLPIAFVAQDGCETERVRKIPYVHEFDCLFIGGTTRWKLSLEAERLVRAAKRAGLWVHMGRVNSLKRIRYAAHIGCDSVDGTQWVCWRDRYQNWGLNELAAMDNGRGVPIRFEL